MKTTVQLDVLEVVGTDEAGLDKTDSDVLTLHGADEEHIYLTLGGRMYRLSLSELSLACRKLEPEYTGSPEW